jgi:hypothetical protein
MRFCPKFPNEIWTVNFFGRKWDSSNRDLVPDLSGELLLADAVERVPATGSGQVFATWTGSGQVFATWTPEGRHPLEGRLGRRIWTTARGGTVMDIYEIYAECMHVDQNG